MVSCNRLAFGFGDALSVVLLLKTCHGELVYFWSGGGKSLNTTLMHRTCTPICVGRSRCKHSANYIPV